MGARTDGRNLIKEWMAAKSSRKFLKSKSEMSSVSVKSDEQILGIFANDHMPYHLDVVNKSLEEIPSLTEMTLKAIEMLESNENGFFLLVEGGRIDHGHHDTMAKYALDETIELSKAIKAALEKINLKETLVVVTSDHSHTMSYAGYAVR
jgi:alkaline phosphatase